MINRILMELYDDYERGNIESLIDFTNKTFPQNGTDKLFIGCILILFSKAGGFKPRYYASRENLFSIVLAAKEKIGSTNLLAFYVERINTKKGISKYLADVVNDKNIDEYANLIIEYLDQFRPKFVEDLKKSHRKIEEYVKCKDKKRKWNKWIIDKIQQSTGINRLMENHSQTLVNKDFFFIFFLHFIAKKWLKLLKNEGNYDLWKTFKWIAQLTYLI